MYSFKALIMAYWETLRLNYSAWFMFGLTVFFFLIVYWNIAGYISGSPLQVTQLGLTVLIIILVFVEPFIDSWNSPRMDVSFSVGDLEDEKIRSFRFLLTNTGRKSATSARVEIRVYLSNYSAKVISKPDTLNTLLSGFILVDDALIPATVERETLLRHNLEFSMDYNMVEETISFSWTKEIIEDNDIISKSEKRGPAKCTVGWMTVNLSWSFKGLTEHKEIGYWIHNKGKDGKPEIVKKESVLS